MINRVQNPSKMTFNVEVKMIKHPFWNVIKWIIIVLLVLIAMESSLMILMEYTNSVVLFNIALWGEIILLFVIAAKRRRGKDFMIMDDNLDTVIKNNKTNKQMSFNLMELYMNKYATVTNFTYSNTILIKIKKLYGYKVKISGDTNVRDYLVPRFRLLGIIVNDVDDEPSDDD